MMRKIATASLIGIDADFVVVEADLQNGLPQVNVVGLADATIRESRERIRAAIVNSGFQFPKRKITINLSPAGVQKEGSHFDLPIAMGILGTSMEEMDTEGIAFIGELSLDGSLKGVRGALPLAMRIREEGITKVVVPGENAPEVGLLKDLDIYPVSSLAECVEAVCGGGLPEKYTYNRKEQDGGQEVPDFRDVAGQEAAKRGLVVAAAGCHGVLMMGSPGSGKTMMARRLPYIMPEMTYEEVLEVTRIYSAAGLLDRDNPVMLERPFRGPHHTISRAALIGGGAVPRPGEISLAHNGILFLDEFGEFDTSAIELLRQPMEEGTITVHRARAAVKFPCALMLVAAANPCKCGYAGDELHMCTCTTRQLDSYMARFSGPMLDRIDMHIKVRQLSKEDMERGGETMTTEQMRSQVSRAVEVQRERYKGTAIGFNSRLEDSQLEKYCRLEGEVKDFAAAAFQRLGLSMRAYRKMLKVARTIADIEGRQQIGQEHIAEALQYRGLEEFYRRA